MKTFTLKLQEPDEPMKFGAIAHRVEPTFAEKEQRFGRDQFTMAEFAKEPYMKDCFLIEIDSIIERELTVPEDPDDEREEYSAPIWDVLKEIQPGGHVIIARMENGRTWIETGDVQVSVELIGD